MPRPIPLDPTRLNSRTCVADIVHLFDAIGKTLGHLAPVALYWDYDATVFVGWITSDRQSCACRSNNSNASTTSINSSFCRILNKVPDNNDGASRPFRHKLKTFERSSY